MATRTPNGFLVFLGSLVALVLVAIILIWSIAAGPKPQDLEAKRAALRKEAREKLEKEAIDTLTTYAVIDPAKGTVRVPVADVYKTVAQELSNKKAAPSQVKIDPPLPMPVVDPTSKEPPMPALPSSPQGSDTIRYPVPAAKPSAAVSASESTLTASVSPAASRTETLPITK